MAMKNLNLILTVLITSLSLVLSSATAMSGPATNPGDQRSQIQGLAGSSNMVCTPQPEPTGNSFKLACYMPDSGVQGANGPARNNGDILRDLYRERNEPPFWKN